MTLRTNIPSNMNADHRLPESRPYDRLRAIIAAAEEGEASPRPQPISAGQLLAARLHAAPPGTALVFDATAAEVVTLRAGVRKHLRPGERVTIYRSDPRAPGGAGRTSKWQAVLIRPGKDTK